LAIQDRRRAPTDRDLAVDRCRLGPDQNSCGAGDHHRRTNFTPVSLAVRHTTLHSRIEWPPSKVKPRSSGSSTVFTICTRAPELVTLRTTQYQSPTTYRE
jgi:hypothetical protein